MLLFRGAYFGVSTQYLWSDMIWWANKSLVISAAITFFSIAFYTNSFLKLKENSVVFYRFMLGFMWYYAILFVAAFFYKLQGCKCLDCVGCYLSDIHSLYECDVRI